MTCIQSLKDDTSQDGFQRVKSFLRTNGYTEQEIDFGLSFYFLTKPNQSPEMNLNSRKMSSYNFRVLNNFEKMIISTETQGLLIQLHQSGFIDEDQYEEIIDQILLTSQEGISEESIKMIVASTIWGSRLSQLFPGGMEGFQDDNFIISIH